MSTSSISGERWNPLLNWSSNTTVNDKIKELRRTSLSIFSKQPMLDLLVLSRFQ